MRLTEEGSKKYVNNYANKNKYMEVVVGVGVEVGGGGVNLSCNLHRQI